MTDYKTINFPIKVKTTSINALTYCKDLHYVAAGKENGLVEVYDASQNYLLLFKVIVSNVNSVDALSFMKLNDSHKLVGVASSKLFIIDINQCCVSEVHILSNNVCGRSVTQCGNLIAVGCDSGYLFLFEYMNELRLFKTIRDMDQAILCTAWSNSYKDIVLAGSINRIYRIDIKTNDVKYFDIGRESIGSDTAVWCACFANNYFCTGDSRGFVTVWDPKNFGIIQRYKTHDQDVLCLTSDKNCVYSSGTDPKIITIDLDQEKITLKRFGMDGSVRGLCVSDKSIIAAGTAGVLCLYELHFQVDTAMEKFVKIVPEHNYECHITKVNRSNIFFYYSNKSINIYELYHRQGKDVQPYMRHLFKVYARNKAHIQSWSASPDLRYLAYSTENETTVLKMTFELDDGNLGLRIKRFNAPENVATLSGRLVRGCDEGVTLRPSSIVKFVQCGKHLYMLLVDEKFQLCVYELVDDCETPLLRTTVVAKEENFLNNIHKIEACDTGAMVAFSTLDGMVFVYSLEKFEIVLRIARHDTPGRASPPRAAAITFNNTNKRVAVIYTNRQIYDVHIASKLKNSWCQNFNRNLPGDWMLNCNPRKMVSTGANKFIILIGKNLIAKLDMEKKVPEATAALFVQRRMLKETTLLNVKRRLRLYHERISKRSTMANNLEKQGKIDVAESIRAKIVKTEQKVKALQSMEIKVDEDCCFTWYTCRTNLVGMEYLPTEKTILTFSCDIDRIRDFSRSKKVFGL